MKQRADQDATGFPERTGIDPRWFWCTVTRITRPRTGWDRPGIPIAQTQPRTCGDRASKLSGPALKDIATLRQVRMKETEWTRR